MSKDFIGKILNDQFRVDAFVDSGGMGAVYRVWDLKRNVPLAMKVLHADLADDPSILKLFQREANALKKLTHPNIVPFYGLFQSPDFAFLLELYIDGSSLKEILRDRQGQPLSIPHALVYLKAVSAALGYAHLHGVVHCDVKPGNVLEDQGGNIYLTDFGIARHAESTATTMATSGTPSYMAPEQIKGVPVSPATDVYALGVVLFEMLTGQRPFRGLQADIGSTGTTAAERIRYGHLHLPPPNPRNLNPAIPEALANVILKALAKVSEERYQEITRFVAEAAAAVGMQVADIPSRVAHGNQKEQDDWKPLVPAIAIAEVVKQPVEEVTVKQPVSVPPRRKQIPRIAAIGTVIAVVVLAVILTLALSGRLGVLFPKPAAPAPETQAVIAAPTHVSTKAPKPTTQKPANTVAKPTSTRKQATSTRIPATRTARPLADIPVQPTSPPRPLAPLFTATQNLFCRDGPGSDYEAHVTITEGQTLPVLRIWGDGRWLLVGIDRTDTRTKCCWIGGEGSLNVNRSTIQTINYLPDRISCILTP